MDELHKESRSIETLLARIKGEEVRTSGHGSQPLYNEPVPEPNRSHILGFYRQLVADELSKGRIGVLLGNIYRVSIWIRHRPFQEMTKDDIIDLVDAIRHIEIKHMAKKVSREGYAEQTVESYKITIKKFWKWLKRTEDYPPEVSWIKRKKKKNRLLPEDIWKPEEVMKLAEVCDNLRDRAFVLSLFSSGCRIGELLLLRRRDIVFDEYGCQLLVNGKTGSRRVRLVTGSSDLAAWLNMHSDKSPESRVWIGLQTKKPVGYEWAHKLLHKLTERAGINKKCNPHLFRHSAATHYAPKLTEQVMNEHFGWQHGGRTVAIYIHMSGKQVDDQILAMYGKKKLEEDGTEVIQSIQCPRCNVENSPVSRFCQSCGFALTEKAAMEAIERRKKADEIMNLITKNPKFIDLLKEVIEEKHLSHI